MSHGPLPAIPRRILVRGVNWLGDAVMTTPALLRLREAFPAAHIALLTPDSLAGLWGGFPVDQVHSFGPGHSAWRVAWRLRPEQFDLGLVFPNSPRSALELWLAGAARRTGYAGKWRRWLLTDPLPPRPGHVAMHKRSTREVRRLIAGGSALVSDARDSGPAVAARHHIHQYLALVGAVGANPAPVSPRLFLEEAEVEGLARRLGFSQDRAHGVPLLGLNPGAAYGPAKRWPWERFAAVAAAVSRQIGCRCLILGGREDQELADHIAAEIERAVASRPGDPRGHPHQPVINLAGRTSLRELCAALKACRVLLTNDTGPMHLAAAVGTPVVALFGSTDPTLTGPGLPGDPRHGVLWAGVPCAPCFRRRCPIDSRCLSGIVTPDAVKALTPLLADAPAYSRRAGRATKADRPAGSDKR